MSITRVIEVHSLGDDLAILGLNYLKDMVEGIESSCYLAWSPLSKYLFRLINFGVSLLFLPFLEFI